MPRSLPTTLPLAFEVVLALALLLPAARVLDAQDSWSFKSELSTVVAEGNSESFTLGVGLDVRRAWESSELRVEAGGVRTESGKVTRRAVGTPDDFEVESETDHRKTAESFYARARYDHELSDRFFAFGGVDWIRNVFAGIDSRFLVAAGAGNTWVDRETFRLEANGAVTFTFQNDVVSNPFVKQNFPGVRGGYEMWKEISPSAEAESVLTGDLNLDETDDLRLDWTNSLSVDVTSALALKPSLQLVWRNQPSLTKVPLVDAAGEETGESVRIPLEKLDSFFRVALVVTL